MLNASRAWELVNAGRQRGQAHPRPESSITSTGAVHRLLKLKSAGRNHVPAVSACRDLTVTLYISWLVDTQPETPRSSAAVMILAEHCSLAVSR